MTRMNFDLEDGLPRVSFDLKPDDAERFCTFMAECTQALKQLKRLEITEMFLNAVLGLAGITPDDGDIDPAVVADAFRNKYITPEVQAAIERDTPKKPLNRFFRYRLHRGYCPSCRDEVTEYEYEVCRGCGQRLDWSEE